MMRCILQVRNANHGDFIIRQSRGSDTFVLCVNDSGAPSSFQINVNDSDAGALKFEFARSKCYPATPPPLSHTLTH